MTAFVIQRELDEHNFPSAEQMAWTFCVGLMGTSTDAANHSKHKDNPNKDRKHASSYRTQGLAGTGRSQ